MEIVVKVTIQIKILKCTGLRIIQFDLKIFNINESRDDLLILNDSKKFLCLLNLFCRRWNESIYIIFTLIRN